MTVEGWIFLIISWGTIIYLTVYFLKVLIVTKKGTDIKSKEEEVRSEKIPKK